MQLLGGVRFPDQQLSELLKKLIKRELLQKNVNRLIIPTSKVRDLMKDYRHYIYKSNKKSLLLFDSLDLKNNFKDNF